MILLVVALVALYVAAGLLQPKPCPCRMCEPFRRAIERKP